MWNLAARAKALASQHFANLHRIKFQLHSIFFENNSFFVNNKMDTVRKTRAIILQRFDTFVAIRTADFPKSNCSAQLQHVSRLTTKLSMFRSSHRAVRTGSAMVKVTGKGSPHSIAERRVPELIPVLGSRPAGDVSHKPGGRLPLLSARPAVTLATLKRAATSFAAW